MGEKAIRIDGRVLGIEGIIARADEHGTAGRGERLGGLHGTIQNGGGWFVVGESAALIVMSALQFICYCHGRTCWCGCALMFL